MNNLTINVKDSYGIENFTHTFTWANAISHAHTHIVYAQNGTMKSSLAKTLYDHSQGVSISDHIYGISGSCSLTDDSGAELPAQDVLSVPSFDSSGYECDQMSLLVASERLKKQYDELLAKYTAALDAFLSNLKNSSGVKRTADPETIMSSFCSLFGENVPIENFVHIMKVNKTDIENAPDFLQNIRYTDIDTAYVKAFIDDNKNFLQDFVSKYDEVLEKSSYLRDGFGTGNAQKVAETLGSEKFFSAKHKVVLLEQDAANGSEQERTIEDPEELKLIFQSEFDKIFNDPKVKEKFQKTLKKLDQANHADLKRVLTTAETRPVVGYLNDFVLLKRRLWFAYMKKHLDQLEELIKLKDDIKDGVAALVESAKKEQTEWDNTVKIFNDRFVNLPFTLEIENKHNIMLEGVATPTTKFIYHHKRRGQKSLDKKELMGFLSTGERKALYLLNLLFEFEVRKKSSKPQVVVLDDVVDSFDYKNKYAFLEYLHELSAEANNIHFVILTHNFDFFRLMQSRFFGHAHRENSWNALKVGDTINLIQAGWFDPFPYIKGQAPRNKRAWLSLIPFARNLVEYSAGMADADFTLLTSCLHLNTPNKVTASQVAGIFNSRINVASSPYAGTEDVCDQFIVEADLIATEALGNQVDLPNKILLSIASRLKAEEYMKGQLTAAQIQSATAKRNVFTRELYNEYILAHPNEKATIAVLDSVNLITPENIHINAFMYEPLIDMGEDELRALYTKVKAL